MECCRDGCPSGRIPQLHRLTLVLGQSDYQVLGHLPDQGPSLQFGQAASSRRVLVVPNFLHLITMEATVFLAMLQKCVGTLSPRAVPRHNPVSELYRQFLRPHGLVFALTCTVNCGTLYTVDRCVHFPNQVQSIEFTTGGLQSSCRNISRRINGNGMHLSSISSLIAKGLITYVNI